MAAPSRARSTDRTTGLLGACSAEFLGTLILILFGDGVVAQVSATSDGSLGGHDSIAWAWGIAVTLAIYVAGRRSGAHINPAVTLSLAVFEGFAWRKVAPYMGAQLLGAFTGALLVRWNYTEALAHVDPGHTIKTQTVFATLPGNGSLPVSEWGALRDQIIGTAILLLVIRALGDVRNAPPLANMAPLLIGLLIVVIGMSLGADAGYAINPARDLGPRVAEYITGYGTAFRDQYGGIYFWVPIVGPLVGGLVGSGLYEVFIRRFLPDDPDVDPTAEPESDETGTVPEESTI
ncbi:MIP/aquaporin family protein [Jatrophihabitans endophyticus]|uniref:MIP/aquaporin family protein n=1 Tax=Jatrophihabitans endophyticus TaxID=1206085 RepID=UPI001A0EF8D3|nr:MIP/aquaporin family protein [Jatrophihabitans endophyticus]MBE7189256.1 aquaporin family protein [Jatrophihabitans endophyticus]